MTKLLLKNALIVTPSRIIRGDLLTENRIISRIDKDILASDARIIDCHESIVLPGLIDDHVHFREPGMERKATIASESKAAVLGGVTSYLDMPNNIPACTTMKDINYKKSIALRDSLANYGFYLGASDSNLEEIKNAPVKEIAGIKVFMGSSTGSLLLEDTDRLVRVFENARTIIALHCEDTATIKENEARALSRYGDDIPFAMHPIIRSRDCCMKSTALAIAVARHTGARIHLMHVSTAEEVQWLSELNFGNVKQRQISGEACIPHLYFSESCYEEKKGFIKCNPAIKTERDRRAIVKAVEDGILTTVGTDHAPHELEYKTSCYRKCPSGMPSVQYSLLSLLALWKRKELTLETIARVTAANVAERFHIKNRGRIQEGYYADLAIINPLENHQVTRDDIASSCGWSPFEGETFPCTLTHTIVNGTLVVENQRIVDRVPAMALEFDR